jgi:gamma-glutamyltranspeptidase/glutathione hydrolase
MGVLQTLLNVIDFGMPISDAVAAPRFSATSDIIDVMNRIPEYVVEPLREAGYDVVRSPLSYGIAGVHAIERVDGMLRGGADPGLDGVALAV